MTDADQFPDVFAAGTRDHPSPTARRDPPLGTTAHKAGPVRRENALGGSRHFVGSLGTQVVKILGQAAARTGPRCPEATPAGFDPGTVGSEARASQDLRFAT
jgi:hypothetical protein